MVWCVEYRIDSERDHSDNVNYLKWICPRRLRLNWYICWNCIERDPLKQVLNYERGIKEEA